MLFSAAAVIAILAPMTAARADPSVQEIQQQINQSSANLEKTIEQYNKVTELLKANQAKADSMRAQLGPLQKTMDDAYASVSKLAVAAYKGGPMGAASAMLSGGSPGTFLSQLATLDQIAHHRSIEIDGYKQAKAAYETQAKDLDTVIAQESAQQAALVAEKSKIQTGLNNLYAMRTKAYGTPTETPTSGGNVSAPNVSGKAGIAVRYAYGALGTPYVWAGASSSGYDCSGLTMAAWAAAGVSLPHNAAMQYSATARISRSQLQPGDLVFYLSLGHVAIYVGSNQVIHAPQPGEVVKLASVDMMSPYGYGRVRA